MNESDSLVSVILGVNRDDGTLLESIKSVLSQTHNNLELIIVNDGSSQEVSRTIGKISDDRIILINSNKIGLTAALNIALKESKGTYIARHDAGDFSSKNRFYRQIEFLKNNPNISMCGSWIKESSLSGVDLGITPFPASHSEIHDRILYTNVFCHGSIMAKKDDIIFIDSLGELFSVYQSVITMPPL